MGEMSEERLAEIEARADYMTAGGSAALTALAAEVRRLRAELAAHTQHTDRAIDGIRAALPQALAAAREELR